MTTEIVETVQPVRSPQEWGELWKRERERKPVRGERISIVRCALSSLKEVVARTPVDGSCVTALVKQIESHTSPQDTGKTLLRIPSTQTIRKCTKVTGHIKKKNRACALFLTLRQSSPAAASPDSDASWTPPHKSASDSPLCPCTSAGSARFWTPAPAPA